MSDWSRDAARRIREKSGQKRAQAEKVVQDRKIQDDALALVWRELSGKLFQMCSELNEEQDLDVNLSCVFQGQDIVVHRTDTDGSLRGTRTAVSHKIEFSGTLPNRNSWRQGYTVRLDDRTGGWRIVDEHERSCTIDEIADGIISAVAEA